MSNTITMQVQIPVAFVAWIETELRKHSSQHLPGAPEVVVQLLVNELCSTPLPPELADDIIAEAVRLYGDALAAFSRAHVSIDRPISPRPRD